MLRLGVVSDILKHAVHESLLSHKFGWNVGRKTRSVCLRRSCCA